MSTFAVLLLCIQACLLQNVFGQYLGGCGCGGQIAPIAPATGCGGLAAGAGWAGMNPGAGWVGAYPGAGWAEASTAGLTAYGGAGEGNVAVAGELPVAGTTAVAGQVPIMGAVSFGGAVPAAGAVSITGQCACGCGAPHEYLY